jgi:HK97 family phage portal protein
VTSLIIGSAGCLSLPLSGVRGCLQRLDAGLHWLPVGLFTRAIRPPPDDIVPNPNDPASVPPSTVGPDQLVTPGDPHGVIVEGPDTPASSPPRILPSAWSGWPAEWWPPLWGGRPSPLTDVAWMCVDYNASILASMPPYLVEAAPTLSADWLRNPDADVYTCWDEFMKQLAWDYQLGEAFVLATARYSTGWPARFHVVPPWLVEAELGEDGRRRYRIGDEDVTPDMLHVRYQSTVGNAHGHGPLEVGQYRVVAAQTLVQYSTGLASRGGIPSSILKSAEEISPEQAVELQAQWVQARMSKLGEPAVLGGGLTWEATQMSPDDMAMTTLLDKHEGRICYLLGVPGHLVGVNPVGDSMTYQSVLMLFLQHWRAGLRPKAQYLMSSLSEWLLPRGTRVELNRDAYIEPEPLVRAQTAAALNAIVDADGNPALTVQEIRASERLDNSTPEDVAAGVLR